MLSLYKQTVMDIVIEEMVVPLLPRSQRSISHDSTLSDLIDWSSLQASLTLDLARITILGYSSLAATSSQIQPENCWEILKAGGSLEDRIVYTTYKQNFYGFVTVDSTQHPSSHIRSSSKRYSFQFAIIPDIWTVIALLL